MRSWREANPVRRAPRPRGACLRASTTLLVALVLATPVVAQGKKAAPSATKARVNELTLARLRPGRATLAEADKLYGAHNRTRPDAPDTVVFFLSACWRSLHLELDERNLIQTLTLRDLRVIDRNVTDCSTWDARDRVTMATHWTTGRGVGLGSAKKTVLAIYGAPQSSGPSTQNGRAMELLFYAFDWAGPDVPQVMEVTLERGRVVQITLAFPSL